MEEEYRKDFSKRLANSQTAQIAVQGFILKQKVPCSINPNTMVPPGGDPNNYKDGGDLFMHFRTEVKHNPSTKWTCKSDYPYSDLLICNCKSVDDQAIPPKYFFIVNGPMTHAALVDVNKTQDRWFKKAITDRRRNHTYDCYVTPLDSAKWITL